MTTEANKLFLSWSGDKSHAVAKALAAHIKLMAPQLNVWESDDIKPGVDWAQSLLKNVEEADMAVFCFTRRNLNAPWMIFELGAFYRTESGRNAIPYLLDLDAKEVDFPTGMMQAKSATRDGTKALFRVIAEMTGAVQDKFDQYFTKTIWPDLKDELADLELLDDVGAWTNLGNAYYLGHDLRWTMEKLITGAGLSDVQHGLRQALHHAEELGTASTKEFKFLAARAIKALDAQKDTWDYEQAQTLYNMLDWSSREFGEMISRRQSGYSPAPRDNQDEWLRRKAEGDI